MMLDSRDHLVINVQCCREIFFAFYILAHNLSPVVSVLELIGHLLRVST